MARNVWVKPIYGKEVKERGYCLFLYHLLNEQKIAEYFLRHVAEKEREDGRCQMADNSPEISIMKLGMGRYPRDFFLLRLISRNKRGGG